jgi:uncharacterized membrane protein YGL010W
MNTTLLNETVEYNPAKHYEQLSGEFIKYHTNPLNVALHFLTTPFGIIGAFSLLRSYTKSSSTTLTITAFYLISLLPILPIGEFVGTLLLCGLILIASRLFKLNLWTGFGMIVASYVLQDLSHVLTSEKTFQSSYSAGGQVRFVQLIVLLYVLFSNLRLIFLTLSPGCMPFWSIATISFHYVYIPRCRILSFQKKFRSY